jgi:hypothetical protein
MQDKLTLINFIILEECGPAWDLIFWSFQGINSY